MTFFLGKSGYGLTTVLAAVFMVLICVFLAGRGQANTVTVMSNHFPPYAIKNDQFIDGFAATLFKDVQMRSGLVIETGKVVHAPFVRMMQEMNSSSNVVGLNIARTAERENMVHWVGPYYTVQMAVLAKADRVHDPSLTLQQISLQSPVAVRGTVPERLLLRQGVPQEMIYSVTSPEQAIDMLIFDRADFFAHVTDSVLWIARSRGIAKDYFKTVHTLSTADLYLGISLSTDEGLILRIDQALDETMSSDVFVAICAEYGLSNCTQPVLSQ